MTKLILFNKPYDVLCQFSDPDKRKTLKDYVPIADVYPAGRLDRDSEGLVLLTDSGELQHHISDPRHKMEKTYWVQVEHVPNDEAIEHLRQGVQLNDGLTRPAKARLMNEPSPIWPRTPPIRQRQNIATQWIELVIIEGKNRQIRRMTAAIGHPTLRLIRYSIGPFSIDTIELGQWREVSSASMIKLTNDLDSSHHRRHRNRTRPSLSDGRRDNRRQTHTQPTSRSSRRRRKLD